MNKEGKIWLLAFIFWFIGDITTTFVGIEYLGLAEANPLMKRFYLTYGYVGMVLFKIFLFMYIFTATNLFPVAKFRIAIASIIVAIGIVVVINNSVFIYNVV